MRRSASLVAMLVLSPPATMAVRAAEPPARKATVRFVQVYDVKEGQLEAMKKRMAEERGRHLVEFPGAASLDTWVDLISEGPTLKTILGFENYAAMDRLYVDPKMQAWGEKLDSFIGLHKHYILRRYPLYRSQSLSYAAAP